MPDSSVPRSHPDAPCVSWNAHERVIKLCFKDEPFFEGAVTVANSSSSGESSCPIRIASGVETRLAESVFLGYPGMHRYSGSIPDGVQAESLVVKLSALEYGKSISLSGTLTAAEGSFTCLVSDKTDYVRGADGSSRSRLNDSVFNKEGDWALQVEKASECRIEQLDNGCKFNISAFGEEIILRVYVDYYRTHLGLYYCDLSRKMWAEPVSGWCSWAAYGQHVNQQGVLATAELFARELNDYGWNIIQIDDGYQLFNQRDPKPLDSGETVADYWVNANDKFPDGLQNLAGNIRALGLTPGIWISATTPLGLPESFYVTDADGAPCRERYAGYAIDGLNEEAVEAAYVDIIRKLKCQGWDYFKIDTLRHLLYDHYRYYADYWERTGKDSQEAFRNIFRRIKQAAGEDTYVLSCWGVLPELADLADGCRIGEDVGDSFDSMRRSAKYISRFQYLNNIIWLNDPDYMCLRVPVEEAKTWATIVALTGGQLMVSDAAECYDEARLDVMRRVGPPMRILPTTLRQLPEDTEIWLLEVERSFERWLVFARTAWFEDGLPERNIRFEELGLDPSSQYLVFDFWNSNFVGLFNDSFEAEAIAKGQCRVYGVREYLGRPQVLATDRHISMGGVELESVEWNGSILSGTCRLPKGRDFTLYFHIPDGWKICESSHPFKLDSNIAAMTLSASGPDPVQWTVTTVQQGG